MWAEQIKERQGGKEINRRQMDKYLVTLTGIGHPPSAFNSTFGDSARFTPPLSFKSRRTEQIPRPTTATCSVETENFHHGMYPFFFSQTNHGGIDLLALTKNDAQLILSCKADDG